MSDHSQRAHALLSASGSHRWLHCTPSALQEAKVPDEASEAAREGTLAHEIAELKLRKELEGASLRGIGKLRSDELYKPEMEECTDQYVQTIVALGMGMESKPYVAIEQRLDLSAYIPEGFGTADCIMIAGDRMIVVDYKHGKGVPVSADHNPQMMLYALGAYEAYKMIYSIKTIRMQIVQPRIDNTNGWECDVDTLLRFGTVVKMQAEKAIKGEGEYRAGEWCKFCRIRKTCRERALENLRLMLEKGQGERPAMLTPAEVGEYITMGSDLADWLKDLKTYALEQCLAGGKIPGYKAVAGRSTREWDDMDKAFADLKAGGVDEVLLYERKPLSLAQVEKMLGKKEFTERVGSHVVKTPGKPTLVVETDRREAITATVKAADVFNTNTTNA